MPGRVAFVPVRYGARFAGGSEALTREIAMGLAGRRWDVEIWTSRVVDHVTWANDLPEGRTDEDGLVVRRFSAVPEGSMVGRRAQDQIEAGTMPPVDDQWSWLSWRHRIPDLYHHILRHAGGFDAVVFSPYMFWNTAACVSAAPANAVVMPCLHDEHYARLEVYRPVLSKPASVWFLSEPEHRLAHRLGPVASRHTVTGAGVHAPAGYDPERFRRRHGITRPFVLYAGRRERDKGWDWLLDRFSEAVAAGLDEIDLVTVGSGDAAIPAKLTGRVRDLGFVEESERNDAFAAALAYVQPSRMESFSRTVMEAWLAGTPVLAVDGGEVVGWHIERSGGGTTFATAEEMVAALRSWLADPDLRRSTAGRGRRYVRDQYAWPVVLDRMESDLEGLAHRPAGGVSDRGAARTLVVGSYAPVPVAGSGATIAQVRREWDAGRDVTVVSPRKSAAHLYVRAAGLRAGPRLALAARRAGAERLVLVAEDGFPVPPDAPVKEWLAAAGLAVAMRRMDRTRLVLVGDPGWRGPVRRMLERAADEVVKGEPGEVQNGVTVLGPSEGTLPERLKARLIWDAHRLRAQPWVRATLGPPNRALRRWRQQRRGR